MDKRLEGFQRLLNIMDDLRAKCPWDKKQTMESLRHLTIEEVFELSDSILSGNFEEIRKELGDILLHAVFYSKIASEQHQFDIADVLHGVCDKLIQRHPHIYGDVQVSGEDEVKSNWEKIKLKEGHKGVLSGVPSSLPSLIKAARIQEKARGVGFDWDNRDQVWEKVQEELQEFREEIDNNPSRAADEFGDLLFSLINFARFVDINPDEALERTNRKFIRRFNYLEQASAADGKKLGEMSLAEMDEYWNKAKNLPEDKGK